MFESGFVASARFMKVMSMKLCYCENSNSRERIIDAAYSTVGLSIDSLLFWLI